MERAILSQRITSILSDISRLTNALYALNTTDIQRYPDNYEVLSTDAALRAERIACQMRNLVCLATPEKRSGYLKEAADAQGIEICQEEDLISITLPGLLPKRKQHVNTAFLHEPLNYALQTYLAVHSLPLYRECVVCFSQVYDRNGPFDRIRDYDNLEFKQLLDTIATYIMVDDSGLYCDSYHTTELGDMDCTRISIMDSKQFPDWLERKQAALQSISEL